ncbi:MAG: hypothetical protein CVU38_18510 [Chloroflexi bacterium HGW-Chloroflexi-1]|nr:MAG: hypothetical protein CVU38_18510 [Chloroflexi bacterium HGW-Chloroflexi-1]
MDDVQGKVTIAPTVLTTIVRLTALEQRGVHRLAPAPPKVCGLLAGGAAEEGIFVELSDAGVKVELHVVAAADANMLKLGEALQANVTRAIEEMVGLPVIAVDVHIDDIVLSAAKTE